MPGDFKGEAYGMGPAVQYVVSAKPIIELNFEYLHDLYTKNRVENDSYGFMIAFEF